MKYPICTIILLWLSAATVFCQHAPSAVEHISLAKFAYQTSNFPLHFKKGSDLYVFGNEVNIRKDSTINSAVLGQVNIGDTVKVVDWVGHQGFDWQGYQAVWYKVKYRHLTGYIWGEWIARDWKWADIDTDGIEELLLLGTSGKEVKGYKMNAEIRILKNQQLFSSIVIDSLGLGTYSETTPILRIVQDEQLNDGLPIVEASIYLSFCAEEYKKAFFYWNGKSLNPFFKGHFGRYKDSKFNKSVYPSDSNGKANQILIQECTCKGPENGSDIWDCLTTRSFQFENGQCVGETSHQ